MVNVTCYPQKMADKEQWTDNLQLSPRISRLLCFCRLTSVSELYDDYLIGFILRLVAGIVRRRIIFRGLALMDLGKAYCASHLLYIEARARRASSQIYNRYVVC